MLERLRVRNFALVDELELCFGPGLNVITGETGAGKSILINAMSLALGERVPAEMAKTASAEVELVLRRDGRSRVLRREIRKDGRSRSWIDDNSSTLTALRAEASMWVDLTAQREGATLLDPDTHLTHLDRLAGLISQAEELETFYHRAAALRANIAALNAKIKHHRETDELARFQLEEIERFAPQPDEDTALDREMRILESAETLLQVLGEAVESLDQGENAAADRVSDVSRRLAELVPVDERVREPLDWLSQAVDFLRDASRELGAIRDTVQLDPERLEELRERRSQLVRLIRKYGGSMNALLETLEDLRRRESGGEELLRERENLQRRFIEHLVKWEAVLERVSKARKKAAPGIAGKIRQGLKSIGVEHPRFEIRWFEGEGDEIAFPHAGLRRVGLRGWDRVEFVVSFNPGSPLKPLRSVVSGGELSRVMLLLKGMSPPEIEPPVLVFDEIDTGISGRVARQVGLRLLELSRQRQVIVVTHLPQIASLANNHFVVEKEQGRGTTRINARKVTVGSDEHVEAVARLVGGRTVTEAARAGARELIENRT